MNATLLIPVLVAVLAGLALAADLVPDAGGRRGVGALVVAGLVGVFAATWFVPLGEGFGGTWIQDAFTVYVQRILLAAGALGALGTIDHADRVFPRRQGEYYLLLLSSLCGMTLLAGARDLVLLVVAFELMGIPLYVMAAMHKDAKAGVEGATKLYLTGAISAALTVYGMSFLVGESGTTRLDALAQFEPTPLFVLGALLALGGMAYKVGAVPFHMWVPDTYQAAPAPFVAFLSVAPKAAAFAAFVRLLIQGLGGMHGRWMPVVLTVCAVTMVLGNLLAIPQSNVRRLLGYSGIAHVGLLLLALALGTVEGVGTMLFYLATYVASNMAAFFVAEAVGRHVGDEIPAWNGLARRNPGLALAMLLALLSLGGIPFVAGFWGKILIFWAAWKAGQAALVLIGALLAVVGLFYYLKIARGIYIEKPPTSEPVVVGFPTGAAIALAIAGVVGLGIFPRPFVDAAMEAGKAVVGVELVAEAP